MMTTEREERSKMYERELEAIYTDWKERNNRGHGVSRAVEK